MKSLSGLDGLFLHLETPDMPMHVGSLSLLSLPRGHRGRFIHDVRRLYARRVPLSPPLMRQLAPTPLDLANPLWVQTESVDIHYHVQPRTVPAPGTQQQLEALVAELHAVPLDRTRPLWMAYIIDGLQSGEVAYYSKIHHALIDGQSAVALGNLLFDPAPRGRRLPRTPRQPAEHPGILIRSAAAARHDAAQYLKFVRKLPEILGTEVSLHLGAETSRAERAWHVARFAPHTPLNVAITGERGFAGVSFPLDELKAIAAAHDATINDVVLASCGGALRGYLRERGGLPSESLIAAVPVSLREPGDTEATTLATMMRLELATHIASPGRRLRAIRDAACAAKSYTHRARDVSPTDFPSFGLPWLLRGLTALVGSAARHGLLPPVANLVVSNVPGPRIPLYFAGARLMRHWPLSIVGHSLGLNVTVESYADALGFGLTTARAAVPDTAPLVEGLQAAVRELRRRPRQSSSHRRTRGLAARRPAAGQKRHAQVN
jgi:diacylglycerol O-acyltransferase